MRKGAYGYTLIEILIVLLIISVVTTMAVLGIRYNEHKQMETFAYELSQTFTLASEQALLEPTVIGVVIGEHSVQFVTMQEDTDIKKPSWQPIDDRVFAKRELSSAFCMRLHMAGIPLKAEEAARHLPQIIFSTNGDVTPFTIDIGKSCDAPFVVVHGDASGISVSQPSS